MTNINTRDTLDVVLQRFERRNRIKLTPDTITCKRYAGYLLGSVAKRVPGSNPRLAKAGWGGEGEPALEHNNGSIYSFHYVVEADVEEITMILDPFLPITV